MTKINILVTEDDKDIRDLIVLVLNFHGFNASTARDGKEAIEIVQEQSFDIILMDVRMPRMTGFEACRLLKEDEKTRNIPIIFLSAKGQEAEIHIGLDAGASDYVLKPFTPDFLIQVINERLNIEATLNLLRETSKKLSACNSRTDGEEEAKAIQWLIQEYKSLLNKNRKLNREIAEAKETNKALQKTNIYIKAHRWKGNILAALRFCMKKPREFLENHKFIKRSERQSSTSNQALGGANYLSLDEFSQVTGGIVHDIRNGLGVIRNTIGFLEDDLTDNTHQSDLTKISNTLNYCELVLRNLSALGGKDYFRRQPVDLEANIREVYFMLKRKLIDVDLVVEADPNTSSILADEGHIKQVFMNLIINAGEAMPNGGTITFRTKDYIIERTQKKKIRIEISDTGVGISEETQKRLFKGDLFTTKETGKGLGLHIVHTIIERHNGTIKVKSEVGKGTTFTLYLPIEDQD